MKQHIKREDNVIDIQHLLLRSRMSVVHDSTPIEEELPNNQKDRDFFHRVYNKVKRFLCRSQLFF